MGLMILRFIALLKALEESWAACEFARLGFCLHDYDL